MAIGRIHAQLAHLVAPLPGQPEPGRALDGHPDLGPVIGDEAVEQPLGHEDVIARGEGDVAQRRAQHPAALDDEVEIIGVAVREIDRIRLVGMRDRDRHVVVEQQRHARVDGRPAPARHLL